ncbi:MAG: hypothetical protein Q9167_002876 [Letrouitia subvulpina]
MTGSPQPTSNSQTGVNNPRTTGAPQPTDGPVPLSTSLPLGAVIVSSSISRQIVKRTFVPTTIHRFATLTSSLSTVSQVCSISIPIVIGPKGVAWQIPSLPPPTTLPTRSSPTTVQTRNPNSSSGGSAASGVLIITRPTNPTQTDASTTAGPGETASPGQKTKQDGGGTDAPSVTAAPLPTITNSAPIKPKSFDLAFWRGEGLWESFLD